MALLKELLKLGFIAFSILLIACSSQNPEPAKEIPPISYLALGDSYTIGQSVADSLRWPIQLSDRLMSNGIQVDSTKIIAKTGWTTRSLINNIEATDLSQLGDEVLVSLLIGVNNQFQGRSFDEFKSEFDELLDMSIQFAGGNNRVFVVSIPDYGVTPFGSNNAEEIAEELDMYNEYISSKCESSDILFVNITEISRTLGSSENALSSDNLHPSGFQYSQWVDKIFPEVFDLIH